MVGSAVVGAIAAGFLAYMISGALASIITGTDVISGAGIGNSAAGSVLGLIPGVREVLFAVSLVQLCIAVHNGHGGEAMLGLVCGLVAGYFVNKIHAREPLASCVRRESGPEISRRDAFNNHRRPLTATEHRKLESLFKDMHKKVDKSPWKYDDRILHVLENDVDYVMFTGDPQDVDFVGLYEDGEIMLTSSFMRNPKGNVLTLVHEGAHAYHQLHNGVDFFVSSKPTCEAFAIAVEKKFAADNKIGNFPPDGDPEVITEGWLFDQRKNNPKGVGKYEKFFKEKY